ncbi:hypothetical protein [Desulfovibrio sp. JC010]|uniref:hypothetical protein n=1 Tax=Desulfovibrio sp. JC010 TaxID=2593641 RepID=UPI0013D65855|nr:hypothetical protein [Desulfovibrio sp. JC010]NDV27858.1 hypothetical protein [Desulfovibrio sp. JC010]
MNLPEDLPDNIVRLVQSKLAEIRRTQGETPMGRAELAAIRNEIGEIAPIIDPLTALMKDRDKDSSYLQNRDLGEMLRGVELGEYALCAQSLNYLEKQIIARHPKCILELGSGVSTLALQTFCRPLREAGQEIRIFSVEQSDEYAAETRTRLSEHNLEDGVEVVSFPTHDVPGPSGHTFKCYDLSGLPRIMGDNRADFVLIDGPLGLPGSRVLTLPDLIQRKVLADNAFFLMDDALRDGEQWVYDIWLQRKDIDLQGVVWVGKGFLAGNVIL